MSRFLYSILFATLLPLSHAQSEQSIRGQQIYQTRCAECHGADGQGVADVYDEPLAGDLSIRELADLISRTMPEGEPEKCTGKDAESVAQFVFDSFYSERARWQKNPPQIRLTHLTAEQLRQSLADIYGHFYNRVATVSDDRGLKALYYDGARLKRENRKIDRIDGVIDFDWKRDGPGEGIKGDDFYVQWLGGLKVDQSGRYEIVIRSSCAFIFRLGHPETEFVNNHVQSGDRTEFRRSVTLTAGRVYPIRFDLYQRKRKTGQLPASVSLSWKPPHGVETTIPKHHLVPEAPRAAFALQTHLPPDDRSYGYNRGLAIDRQWDDAVTAAAIEFGQTAATDLWPEYRRRRRNDEEAEVLSDFLSEIATLAFRGPLDQQARQFYIQKQIESTDDRSEAIRRSVLAVLKSPWFLYPSLDSSRSESRQVANRLALTLYDSLPSDSWLLNLAEKDLLKTETQITSAAKRMVHDYRARAKVRALLYEWLHLSEAAEIQKKQQLFPEFSENTVAQLKDSLDRTLDAVVWSEQSDYRSFFQSAPIFTSDRIHAYYGDEWSAKPDQTGYLQPTTQTGSLLTHPYLMSRLAYQDSTSPIHRGVFLMRFVLGRTIRPPQEAFTPLSPDLHPDLTTRQRVELQTSPQSCQVCHRKINGLGFVLENYDSTGRFRQKDHDRPVNVKGSYTQRDGSLVQFTGPAELAEYLANSHDAHTAFVNRSFQHLVKQPVAAWGYDRLDELTRQFRQDNCNIRRLLVDIAVVAARPPQTEERVTTNE